jgi:hypothetical protein
MDRLFFFSDNIKKSDNPREQHFCSLHRGSHLVIFSVAIDVYPANDRQIRAARKIHLRAICHRTHRKMGKPLQSL